MRRGGEDARAIVGREGLTQVADEAALGRVIDQVLARSPRAIEDYKRGKTAAAKALVGQVMKATGGKANPGIVNRDRKSTRLNSSHLVISYAVFCLKKKKNKC